MKRKALSSGPLGRRALRVAGWLGTLALVGYHVYLFAGRLRDASLARPEVGLRWAMALALVGLAVVFRHRGLSVWRGKPAIVFWVLALLLHLGPLPMPALSEPLAPLLTALPWGLAASLATLVLAAARRRPDAARWRHAQRRETPPPPFASIPPLARRLSPRPPPAA